MGKVLAALFLSLDGVTERPDELVTDMEENLAGVPRPRLGRQAAG
jgi:hypothetical protein